MEAFHGQQAIKVDPELAIILMRYSWGLDSDGYPKAKIGGKHIRLHQAVLGAAPQGMVIDHVNQDKLDNRRSNLRFVSYRANALNSDKAGDGAWYNKSKNRWQAQHKINGRRYHIGTFLTREEAVSAYRAFVTALGAA